MWNFLLIIDVDAEKYNAYNKVHDKQRRLGESPERFFAL